MPGTAAIRRARRDDAAALTALARRSKAAWGYDAEFMAACREELTIAPDSIAARPTWVIEERGAILGFYQLRVADRIAKLEQLFIVPGRLRGGLGRWLWPHLEGQARAAGCTRLEVDSDPYAEGFYQAMGMIRCGAAPSGSIPGRKLPRLAKTIRSEVVGDGAPQTA